MAAVQDRNGEATVVIAPSNTCGFQDGKKESAVTCLVTTAKCVFIASEGHPAIVNCCDDPIACAQSAPTACMGLKEAVDSGICKDPNCGGIIAHGKTFICGNSLHPYCVPITYAEVGATGWNNCGAGNALNMMVKTTYEGQVEKPAFKTQIFHPTPTAIAPPEFTLTGSQQIGVMPTAPTTTVPTTDPGVDLGVEPSVNINPHPSSLKVGIIAAGIIGGLVAFIAIILVIWRFKKVRASRNRNQNEEADLPGSPLTISTVGPTSTESSGSFAIPLTPVPTNETQEPTANIAEIATARSITLRPVRPAMVSAKNEEVKPNSVAAKEGTATEGTAKEVKTDDEMARKVVTHPMISQPVVPELVPLPTSHLTNLEEPLSGQGSVEFTTTRNYDPDAETYVLPEEISGHRRRARPMSAKSLD